MLIRIYELVNFFSTLNYFIVTFVTDFMAKTRVLLVDDNTDITSQIGKFLKIKGYDYVESNSGRNGVELISNSKFDFVILDLAMPDFSGYDVIDELKTKNLMGNFVLIVLTASEVSDETRKRLHDQNIKLLEKPVLLKN